MSKYFFHINFTCNLSHSWMNASCSFTPLYVTTSISVYFGYLFISSAIHIAACSRIHQGFPVLNTFFSILCKQYLCKKSFFMKNNFLYYFKIFLYEAYQSIQKYIICVLPIISLNLILLTLLFNFISYWTEFTLFIVSIARSQVHISLLDHLSFFFFFFSSTAEYFCHSYIQWNHLTFA